MSRRLFNFIQLQYINRQIIIQMGQGNNGQAPHASQYTLIRDLSNGSIVRQATNDRLHFLKEYSFTNQQAYQQAFVNFSKKLPEKHEHILFLQRTNTKLQNTFCSTFYKISLLYEYLEHNLQKEIEQRITQKKTFDQKEVWSVLCSCTLAVNQMIRFERRSHSALKTKDIRLTSQGVVKILSLQMIGMDSDHDANQEGTTRQLALTVLNCLLMEEITNNQEQFLLDLVQNLQSTSQMKNILRLMLSPNTKFIQLEQYLFKLVQQETDSLNSLSNTPMIRQKMAKQSDGFSKIPQQSKQMDILANMTKDQEDYMQNSVLQPFTQEDQQPDELDLMDFQKSKTSNSQTNTLRQNNCTPSPQKQQIDSLKSSKNFKKQFQNTQTVNYQNNLQNSLFTDPKLLKLIHTDLQDIKKRKSIAGSRKIGLSESVAKLKKSEIQQNNQMIASISIPSITKTQSAIKNVSNPSSKNLLAKNQTKQTNYNKESEILKQSNKEVAYQKKQNKVLVNSNLKHSRSQSRKQQNQNSTEQIKTFQKRYQNIMQNDEMGFKKNKNVKSKQESKQRLQVKQIKQAKQEQKASNNSLNSNFNTIVYNSNSSFSSNTFPLNNHCVNQKINNVKKQVYYQQPQQQLQYVTETYVRGRYEGTKKNNVRHGKGVFYYSEGGKYVGEWNQNKMHGKGILYYPNNSIAYDGQWQQDQLWGQGVLYNQEVTDLINSFDFKNFENVDQYWVKYEGSFLADSKNGQGKLYLTNGQIFEGKFKEDMIWGQGVFLRRDGTKIKGIWRQNKLIRLV